MAKRPALFNILGLTVATFFHGAFSILGLSALLLQSAELFLSYQSDRGNLFVIHWSKSDISDIKKDPKNSD